MIKVYGDIYSGNCYKIKLLLNHLEKEHEWQHINVLNSESRTEEFLRLNPNGKIPLLQTADGLYLSESNAILLHLSEGTELLPEEKWQRAKVYQWLFFEQYSHEPYVAVARFFVKYLNQGEEKKDYLDKKREQGYKALQVMETELEKTKFLAGDQYSVADISLYAYTHVAHEGGFELKPYKKVRKWLKRVGKQESFISMDDAAEQINTQETRMTNVVVVKPEADDRPKWRQLYQGYADFYQVPMNDGIMDTLWGWIHDEHNPFYCIVAKDEGGNLLGFMHFRAMPSPLRGAMIGFLDDLFITPEARGKGVVSALYHELENQGKANGWPLIRWITAENNYRARAVYDGLSNKTHWVTYQLDL